jgi:hypothetical protein
LSTNSSRHQFGKHGSKLFGTKNIKPKLGPDQTDITSYPNQTSPLKSSIQFSPTQTGLIQKKPVETGFRPNHSQVCLGPDEAQPRRLLHRTAPRPRRRRQGAAASKHQAKAERKGQVAKDTRSVPDACSYAGKARFRNVLSDPISAKYLISPTHCSPNSYAQCSEPLEPSKYIAI